MMKQAPRTSRASLVKGSSRSVANTEAQRALIAHWQGIVKSLGNFLNTLKANHVSGVSFGSVPSLYIFCFLLYDYDGKQLSVSVLLDIARDLMFQANSGFPDHD
jgi:hypothetical protein